MQELFLIRGTLIGYREVGDVVYPYKPRHAVNLSFYDPKSGEIWGQRIYRGTVNKAWYYIPRREDTLDLTVPKDWNEFRELSRGIPLGVAAVMLAGVYACNNSAIVRCE